MINTSTLRPGLLVSLKTSIAGNTQYQRRDIERDHITKDGVKKAKWETERLVSDPQEAEAAEKARSDASNLIRRVCTLTPFGLLCPESDAAELSQTVSDARAIVEAFNEKARLTRVSIWVMIGKIAADDVQAVKDISREMRDLMTTMERGIKNLNVERIREAASTADAIGKMLSPEMEARVALAVSTARETATKIKKAGVQAAQEIDKRAIRKIAEQRTAFLDLDDVKEVAAPKQQGRSIDMTPDEDVSKVERKAYGRVPGRELDL